jgi:hypothetical protein
VLTQQLQEPVTESAQEDKYIHSKENNNNNNKHNNNMKEQNSQSSSCTSEVI